MPQLFKSAIHLFLIKDQQTLLSLRANTGYMDSWFSVIAGHIEPGETVNDACVREAREEAGLTLLPEHLEIVGVMHRSDGEERIDFFVRAHAWDGEIHNTEPHKCTEIAWFPLDALPEHTVPYVRQALLNYQQGVWFDSFGWDGETTPID
ncbi:MAG: NUDIX domain-containing protein [Chloroflexota bacterium]